VHHIRGTNAAPIIDKYFAAQSLDNQIHIYSTDNFRQNRKKTFAGHTVAGYACQVGFSPDGKWISSGDSSGHLVVWDWKTKRVKTRLKAHDKVLIAHEWLPHESVSSIAAERVIGGSNRVVCFCSQR
jgi:pre-mRNA-processing factor 17